LDNGKKHEPLFVELLLLQWKEFIHLITLACSSFSLVHFGDK